MGLQQRRRRRRRRQQFDCQIQAEGWRRAWKDQTGCFNWVQEGERRDLCWLPMDQRKVSEDYPETLVLSHHILFIHRFYLSVWSVVLTTTVLFSSSSSSLVMVFSAFPFF
ncbi:hypothetical protein NC651_028696 [Populus alba x Populus x berolinensis]|nr:hypothetical protein NC651_028696 [Populus alba x Populus x berolinensis]